MLEIGYPMRVTKEKGASKNREEQQMAQSKSHEADVQDAQPATGQKSSQKRQTQIVTLRICAILLCAYSS